MIRRLGSSLFAIVAMVMGGNIASQAQPQPLLTHHVREVTLNGQARSVGRLPATQALRFDIVLPLRDQPGLESFLREVYDPSSSTYRHFLTVPSVVNTDSTELMATARRWFEDLTGPRV